MKNDVICPKCAASDLEALGAVRSNLDWFKCRRCVHVWAVRRDGSNTDTPSMTTCRKCGRVAAKPIGRSVGIIYYQCTACGHTSGRLE